MSAYDEVRKLITDSKQLEQAIELNANALADLLERNLHHVSGYRLAKLKAELRGFNAHTNRWKKP